MYAEKNCLSSNALGFVILQFSLTTLLTKNFGSQLTANVEAARHPNSKISASLIDYLFSESCFHTLDPTRTTNWMQILLNTCFGHLSCTSPGANYRVHKTQRHHGRSNPSGERHVVALVILSCNLLIYFFCSLLSCSHVLFWVGCLGMSLKLVVVTCMHLHVAPSCA